MSELLEYGFMQRALLAGVLIALFCPPIGVFLVLRRHALIGDAFAHAALAGIALGLVLNVPPLPVTLAVTLLAALVVEGLRRYYAGYAEMAIALLLSLAVAAAGILLSLGRPMGGDLHGYLFGSLLAISVTDLWTVLFLGLLVLSTLAWLWRPLFLSTFDEEAARVAGVPVERVNLVFIVLTAITVTLALRLVGILLVSSLLIVPVAIALRVAGSFAAIMRLAVAAALVMVLGGLGASFYLDVSPGGLIITLGMSILAVVLVWTSRRR